MKKIINAIKDAKNIAVLTHVSEDADALGSAMAFMLAVESLGKTAEIFISDEPESRLSFMNGKFTVYDKEKEYQLHDLCVCLDCGDFGRVADRESIFKNADKTVNIDHHYTNTEYADENYVVSTASSTGEIVFELIKEMNVEITKEMAEFLYISIVSDSGGFKYSNTSAKTMRIAAELMEKGVNHTEICRKLFDTEKREVMRLNGYIMSNIREYFDGKLCLAVIDNDTFEKFKISEKDSGDIVNIPRRIEGCEVAVSVREKADCVKISFRSNGKYDVTKIAAEFGGGGHKMAAGATVLDMGIAECEERVIKVFEGMKEK